MFNYEACKHKEGGIILPEKVLPFYRISKTLGKHFDDLVNYYSFFNYFRLYILRNKNSVDISLSDEEKFQLLILVQEILGAINDIKDAIGLNIKDVNDILTRYILIKEVEERGKDEVVKEMNEDSVF